MLAQIKNVLMRFDMWNWTEKGVPCARDVGAISHRYLIKIRILNHFTVLCSFFHQPFTIPGSQISCETFSLRDVWNVVGILSHHLSSALYKIAYQCSFRLSWNVIHSHSWLGIRIEFIGSCLVFFAAIFAVACRDKITSGLAGMSLTYSLQVSGISGSVYPRIFVVNWCYNKFPAYFIPRSYVAYDVWRTPHWFCDCV